MADEEKVLDSAAGAEGEAVVPEGTEAPAEGDQSQPAVPANE